MKTARLFLSMLFVALATIAQAQNRAGSEQYYLIDGVDFQEFGSYIPLEDLVNLTDWRGRSFDEYENYWDYYGVTDISVDLETVECDLNDTWQKLPATLNIDVDKTNLTGTYYKQNKAEGTVDSRFGFLTYKNNGTVVTTGFQLRFKVYVDYKWGRLYSDLVTIRVHATSELIGDENTANGTPIETAVESITRHPEMSLPVYDLRGRRVAHPTKGIYIINGRKVVMK